MESTDKSKILYEPLLADSERDADDELPEMRRVSPSKKRTRWLKYGAFAILFIAYSIVLLKVPAFGRTSCLDPFITYTPAKEAIKGYHRHEFDGSLGLQTKYTGEPRPETEEAWAHIFKHYNLRFTAEEMQRLNRTDNPIELQNGGGYFGQISAYHHLHCLSMLRQVLWHDFYNISIPNLRAHADHCINDIRQSLMCHADLSVVTFYWHPEMRKPMPNFHIDQTCVNWDALDAWAAKRSFSIFDQKTLVHPTLGLSFPMVDGEIQVHGGHDHDHKLNHTLDLPPVWPEGDTEHKGHSEGHHGEHSEWIG